MFNAIQPTIVPLVAHAVDWRLVIGDVVQCQTQSVVTIMCIAAQVDTPVKLEQVKTYI